MRKFLLLIAGFLFFCLPANAQPYYFRHYQVEDGLSHNTIFCSVQDNKGFMWFGTKDGLNRFDGNQFKTFSIAKEKNRGALTGDLVLALAVAPNGTLWVGAQNGLFYFEAKQEKFIPFLDTINGINDIFFDNTGQLWFTADHTLKRYNFRTQKTTTFPADWFFSATSMCQAADGTMWFSTTDGHLQQFDAATQSFKAYDVFVHSPQAESKVIQKIVYDKAGKILIGTNNQGIKEFDPASLTYKDVLIHNPDKTTIYIRDILPVSRQETWFASESGVFIRDNTTGTIANLKKKTLDPYSLSDNAVYTLFQDTEGGIWAGTFFGGLNYYPKQHTVFQKFFPDYTKNSISGNAVREICEDKHGNIWIGTEDAGLNKLVPATGEVTHFEPTGNPGSISYYNIHGLAVAGDELWIGTFEHGLNIMNLNTGMIKKHFGSSDGDHCLKNNFVVSLLQARNGEVYVGTASGAYRYQRKQQNFRYLNQVAEGSFIPCLLEDREGIIWVATHNRGLFYFHPETGVKGHFRNEPGNKNSLSTNSINSIFEDHQGYLWFATEGGGLCRFDKGKKTFRRYNTQNGLPSNFVFKVLEDDAHNLWVTTSKGLVRLNPSTNHLTVYTKANGLLNDQFNYNSGYKDAEGNLYFGSVQGLIKFNPNTFQPNRHLPPVYITALQVQNREIDVRHDTTVLQQSILYTDKITLPYNQSSFSIDFAALGFTSPKTIAYSYIMAGLDKEWTRLSSNRKVYFTNLKPGTYTFKVKADNHGTWTQPDQLTVVIMPPFWATTWAYIFYALALVLLTWYLIRSYHDFQENRKEKEIYQAKIDFFTNVAHEIKTPLTLIKGPVENLREMAGSMPDIEEDLSTMERNTERLIRLINQILDFRQTETKGFSLDFTDVNMNELVQEAYDTFKPLSKKRYLHYSLELPHPEICLMADAEALTKVLHNLFSNAVKYADKQVTARLLPPGKNGHRLVFEISNDGRLIPAALREKIFEPFFRVKEGNKQKGTGLGLALARSLAELHSGNIYLKEGTSASNVFVLELPFAAVQMVRESTTEPNQLLSEL